MNKHKTNVEQFAEKIFDVNCDALGKHFQNTSDRTVWYRVRKSDNTMMVPGLDVLRVNQPELEKFLAAAESFIKFDYENDKRFDWDNLTLVAYHGQECFVGLRNLDEYFWHTAQQGQLIGVDTETRYLDWDDNKLLSIGFAVEDDCCIAFYDIPKACYGMLQDVLSCARVRFAWHNGKFDKDFLLYTCGLYARVDEDSLLKHFSQVSEKKGTHGLKYLGPLYLQAPQWDAQLDAYKKEFCRKNKIKLADFTYDMLPTEILVPYMQRDCIATRRLISVLDEIKEPGTDRVYNLLIKATEVFSCIEINGAKVDRKHLDELEVLYTAQLKEADALVADAISKLWNPAKYCAETGAKFVADFKLSSPKQLKWMLKEATGVSVTSSDKATVEELSNLVENGQLRVSDAAKELLRGIMLSRKASKYLDTYVTGIRDVIRKDGRVSGSYLLHGTETGRLSCQKPNMQNCPRDKLVKNIFCAESGYKLVQLDYSQAEVRVLGVVSNEPFLIKAYANDEDIHAATAIKIFGPNFTKEERTKCKTITFGIAYGRGASAIAQAFKMSRADAQKLIDDWFNTMPKVREYINNQRKAADNGERQQTMFGRVRHYVRNDENAYHIQNEYINTPIQSMASDLTVTSICEIHDWLIRKGYYVPGHLQGSSVRICITVHDSIVLEVRDDPALVEEVAQHCLQVMHDVPERMIENCPLPFKADCEVGYSWGKMEEL